MSEPKNKKKEESGNTKYQLSNIVIELDNRFKEAKNGMLQVLKSLESKSTTSKTPISITQIASMFGIYREDLRKIMNDHKDIEVRVNNIIRQSFYAYSFENKVPKGIELYIDKELPYDNSDLELKVFVDVNDYQKQLEPFTMNVPEGAKPIENPDDKITNIEGDLHTDEEEIDESLVEEIEDGE